MKTDPVYSKIKRILPFNKCQTATSFFLYTKDWPSKTIIFNPVLPELKVISEDPNTILTNSSQHLHTIEGCFSTLSYKQISKQTRPHPCSVIQTMTFCPLLVETDPQEETDESLTNKSTSAHSPSTCSSRVCYWVLNAPTAGATITSAGASSSGFVSSSNSSMLGNQEVEPPNLHQGFKPAGYFGFAFPQKEPVPAVSVALGRHAK